MRPVGRAASPSVILSRDAVQAVRAPGKSNAERGLTSGEKGSGPDGKAAAKTKECRSEYHNGTSENVPLWHIKLYSPFVAQILGQILSNPERCMPRGYESAATPAPALLDRHA